MLDPAAITHTSSPHRAFGDALRRARRRAGLTQQQFAAKVGYSRAQIASLELGRRAPPDAHSFDRFRQILTTALTSGQMMELTELAHSAGKHAQPPGRKPHPSPPNTLFGREADLHQIISLLTVADGGAQRLITVSGPGGIGKTRLVLEIAAALQNRFDTVIVRLDAVTSSRRVNACIAQALDLPGRLSGVEHMVEFINQRHMLLILDNCEHVLDACTRIADTLLSRCPDLRILATSRERLGTSVEQMYPLLPLQQIAARQLFAERARLAGDFRFDGVNASKAVDDICKLLGGLPLAIEIAAAQLPGLSLSQLSSKLRERFLLEMPGRRGGAARHASLRKLIDWSYNELSRGDAAVLRWLSIFSGSASLEAIEHVIKSLTPKNQTADPVVTLLGLVAKSLVVTIEDGGTLRYMLLDSVRMYAAEKLQEAGEESSAHSALLAFLAKHAARLEDERAEFGRHRQFVQQLTSELGNIRATLDWRRQLGLRVPANIDRDARALVAATFWYWYGRGHWQEGADLFTDVILASPHASEQECAAAKIRLADLLAVLGRYAEAHVNVRQGMALLPAGPSVSRTLGTILQSWLAHDATEAMEMLEDALATTPPDSHPWDHCLYLLSLGSRATRERAFARAESALRLALEIAQSNARARGNLYALLIQLGEVAVMLNDYPKAAGYLEYAQRLEAEWRSNDQLSSELWLRGVLAIRNRDAERASDIIEEWHALFRSVGRGSRIELALLIAANLAIWANDSAASAQLHQSAVAAQALQTAYTSGILAAYHVVVEALPPPASTKPPLTLNEACDLALTRI